MNYTEFRERYQWNPKTDKLGEGGFAKVYRATDKIRDRLVVLKVADVPLNHKFSLQREVELNRDLTPHPNIAQYRNCYRLEDTYGDEKDYATMDYFSEGSLNVVMNKYLSPDDIRTIVTGMLRGLAHLESENVIHRDFKPGNVLMARDADGLWLPKIADFGLSRFTESDITVSNSSVGISYDYAAPEQFQPGSVNRQADLWAFGVIVYRLCMGKSPFSSHADLTGESRRLELVQLINQAQLPDDVAQISEPYYTLIRRCVVKELSLRARSANELLSLLIEETTPAKSKAIPTDSVIDENDAETHVETKVKPEPVSKPKPEPVSKPKPEPVSKPKPEPVSRPKPEPVSRPKPEPVSRPKPEPVSKPKSEPVSKPKPEPVSKPKPEPVSSFVKPLTIRASTEARAPQASPESQSTTKRSKYRILALLLLLVCFVAFYFVWRSPTSRPVGALQSVVGQALDSTHTAIAQPDKTPLTQATNNRPNTLPSEQKPSVNGALALKKPVTTTVGADRKSFTETPIQTDINEPTKPEPPEPTPAVVKNEEKEVINPSAAPISKPTITTADKPDNSGSRPASGNRTLRLSGGATILVSLREPVAAATAREGQNISLEVVKPILVDGEIVIPQGADVTGEVANVSSGGKKDMLEIRIRGVRGIGGQVIGVRAATFRYVGSRNEPLVFKAGQQFIVYTAGAHKFSL